MSCMRDTVLKCAIVLWVLASVHSSLAAAPDKCPADEAARTLVRLAGFPNDPVLLSRGVLLRQKASDSLRRLQEPIDRNEEFTLSSDSTMTFTISGDHVLASVTGGRWHLRGTLEVEFAGRYEPHKAAVFTRFASGPKSFDGRFERVVLPAGWLYDLQYDREAGTVTLRNLRPDRAAAFPGAEGFGKYTLGGRGGKVYEVTNLDDSGPGSLRWACQAAGPRTVVFRTSGTIALKSKLKIENPYITIAGQTAPGDGICLRDNMMEFETDHVIVRYMRFRLGDAAGQESDSFGGEGHYAIIDHCSAGWSVDETFSINKASNLTVQWCMVTESLHDSIHKKGKHGYGGEGWPRNWINNYYKYGPGTNESVRHRIFIQQDPRSKMYAAGNFVWGYPKISADNWNGGIDFQTDKGASIATLRVSEPFVVAPVRTQDAAEAYETVLKNAGASLVRDAIDKRIIEEIRTGTATYGETWRGGGKGIINSQTAAGGWPALASLPAPRDDDHDGMPDTWELAHGLDAADPADGPQDRDRDGYTNLEEYLNSLVASM